MKVIVSMYQLRCGSKVSSKIQRKDLGSWTHIIPTLTRQLKWHTLHSFHTNFTSTLGLRASSDYAQVEKRSVTSLDQSMSRGEAFGLKIYIKIIHLKHLSNFEYFNEIFGQNSASRRKFGSSIAREAKLLAPQLPKSVAT